MKRLSIAAAVIFVISLFWPGAYSSSTKQTGAASDLSGTSTNSPVSSAAVPASASEGGPRLSASEFADVKQLGGIATRQNGTVFQVFSDPKCPYCKELDRSLSKLDVKFNPVILPLGFRDGSRDLAASIICSANPAKAWSKSLLEGVAPDAKPCDKGYAQVDANMAMFRKLLLNSTPTMVTPSGFLVVGSGEPSVIATVMGK